MRFKVEFEHEEDGRWIAEIPELPGVLAYGATQIEAEAKVKALAETEAQAMAAMTQMRAAGANQIYQLFTPEQRKKADELKAQFEADGPRRAGPPPADAPAGKRR